VLTIKKTSEADYLAFLTRKMEKLSRNDCYLIKRDLGPLLKPHRVVSLDLKGVTAIDRGGCEILADLKNQGAKKHGILKIINLGQSINQGINQIAEEKQMKAEELDAG